MHRFEGLSIMITGAASGIGKEVALNFAQEGAKRVILLDIDTEKLDETRRQIGARAEARVYDVTQEDTDPQKWAEMLGRDGLDILVTAAGIIGTGADIEHCSLSEWDRIFAVNVKGTYLIIKTMLRFLRLRRGSIVTIGSTAGLVGSLALGPYSASKGAITTLTKSLALKHAIEGIRVNCVCPGSINGPMLESTFRAAGNEEAIEARRAHYLGRYPMGRFGEMNEVSQAVLFLASKEASYITGVCLPVDGGMLA